MKSGVLHLIDSLAAGGAERVAVNLVNGLSREMFQPHLCATRRGGPLEKKLAPDVSYFCLNRRSRLDFSAIWKLAVYIRQNHIQIIHAHGTSLFIGHLVKRIYPECKLIWHVHYGAISVRSHSTTIYKLLARNTDAIFSVTRALSKWTHDELLFPESRTWYIPNYVPDNSALVSQCDELPGISGRRLVCIANLRTQKDHLNLFQAFRLVVDRESKAHLILVGAEGEYEYAHRVWTELNRLGLKEHITWLGPREDVPAILSACDIGVLSSASEGFPLTLLEYGQAGLAVVATSVGECPEILDEGKAGILVPPRDPAALASALLELLAEPLRRHMFGLALQKRVKDNYSPNAILEKIEAIYKQVLDSRA